jgi:DNA-binding response OmpR family regulator
MPRFRATFASLQTARCGCVYSLKSHCRMATDSGAARFFHKPFEANAFVAAIEAALRNRSNYETAQPEIASGRSVLS